MSKKNCVITICYVSLLISLTLLGTPLTHMSPQQSSNPTQAPEINKLRFQVIEDPPTTPPPDEILYVNNFTAEYVEWDAVGAAPYLDAVDNGSYIEGTAHDKQMGWFSFENRLGNATIKKVVLEGYTNGPYNEDIDYDMYAQNFTWLGSLYATWEPAWVTPRWIGKTVDEAYPAVLTEEGLNSLQVLARFYDPSGYGGAGNIVDALRLKVWYQEWPDVYTRRLEAMQNRTIDVLTDLRRPEDIEKLENESFTITSALAFHMGHIGYNIRPLNIIKTHGRYQAAIHPVTDWWPLEDVNFRHALFHCYDQEEIIATIYHDLVEAIRSLVPPAQAGYYNALVPEHPYNPGDPRIKPGEPGFDPHSASGILWNAGYNFTDANANGVVDDEDYWKDPVGDPLPDIHIYTPTYEVAPTSAEHGASFIRDLGEIGLAGTLANDNHGFIHEPADFWTYLTEVFQNATFDAYMVFWALGRFPDHLYDMAHSSQISGPPPAGVAESEWLYNAPGINSTQVDDLVETVKFSLDNTARKAAAEEVQTLLYDPDSPDADKHALAYMQLYSRKRFDAFNPGLRGIVNSPGYGSDNMWTFLNMHWKPGHPYERIENGSSTVIWCLDVEPESLNPLSTSTTYAWKILDRIYDPLMAINPYTHDDLPWLADSWEMVETLGGMNVTFWLNSTVEWQDGNPYTAEDARFNWLFLRDNQIPIYSSMWESMVDVEVLAPGPGGVVRVILNVTNPFLIYDLASTAALLPPPVWSWLDGKPQEEILAYDPSLNTTKPTGAGPRFGMADGPQNQLYGTGPYIFQFYDQVEKYADLYANRYYWKTTDEIQGQLVEMFWACGDVDQNGVIDQTDQDRMQLAYGSTPEDANWDLYCDLNQDGIVDAFDVAILNFYFGDRREYPASADTTPPLTAISLSGVLGDNGWFTSNVTVTLSATDDISGVEKIEYSFDNATWATYTAPFIIASEGYTIVFYRSTDKAGNVETVKAETIKIDKTIPSANAGVDQTVAEDALLTFDGSNSSDNIGIVSYTWAFTDITPKTLTGVNPTYTFATPGTYTVTLNVTDAAGNWDTDEVVITVLGVTAPVAVFTYSPEAPSVNQSVTFDASSSYDPDGTIVSYIWDFGDGTHANATNPIMNHIYTSFGTYNVTLTVIDNDGLDNSTSLVLTVQVHDLAILSVTASPTQLYAGQVVNVTVVVKNEGTTNENFTVSVYYDGNIIETITVTNLAPNEETTLTFSWDTTGVAGSNYTILADASVVPGETDTADNTFIDGTVEVTSPVWIVEVIPCNQTGYPKDTFVLGTMAFFKVIINNTAFIPQDTLITINLYDNASVTIGVASFQGPILPGISVIIFGLPIPTTASAGTATVYANSYTDWPHLGGFPHCPEASATLEITGS